MVRSRQPEKGRQHSRNMESIQKAALSGDVAVDVHHSSPNEERTTSQETPGTVLMVTCFLGIFVSYFVYGLLQEKM